MTVREDLESMVVGDYNVFFAQLLVSIVKFLIKGTMSSQITDLQELFNSGDYRGTFKSYLNESKNLIAKKFLRDSTADLSAKI